MVDISIISISALDLEKMELRVEIYMDQVIGKKLTKLNSLIVSS
jgi:hypothetical protein